MSDAELMAGGKVKPVKLASEQGGAPRHRGMT